VNFSFSRLVCRPFLSFAMADFGPPAVDARGKKAINIQGPYELTQPRVNPTSQFEHPDREWRKTWQHDQKLSLKDFKYNIFENPEYYKATNHIFRRIVRVRLKCLTRGLE
jgi:hypothetical protein